MMTKQVNKDWNKKSKLKVISHVKQKCKKIIHNSVFLFIKSHSYEMIKINR